MSYPKRNNYPFLIRQLAVTDFKIRYSSSTLGYLWSLLHPLLMFGVLFLVFSIFIRWDVPYYALYLLLGVMLWRFFEEATVFSMGSLLDKRMLITKINFPKRVIVISSMATSVLTLFFNIIVFFVFFMISSATLTWASLLFILYIIELIIFASGVSFILCAFYLRFRDLQHLWQVLIQLGFWITPIVYPLSFIPERFVQYILLNPMAGIILDSRDVLIYNSVPSLYHHIVSFIGVVVIFLIGYFIYKKMEVRFAEYV